MAKFKVGDKVRVVKSKDNFKSQFKGREFTIRNINPNAKYGLTSTHYGVNESCGYIWHEDELELVPLTIEEKRNKLLEFCNGKSCIGCKLEDYRCGFGGWALEDEKVDEVYSIVFEGEKDMKQFTKEDLKNGDVVKFKNGETAIAVVDMGTFVFKDGFLKFDDVASDLTYTSRIQGDKYTVMAVRRPIHSCECHLKLFNTRSGLLVYERKEVEEMTLEEVCKALGKEIKIVKK